MLYGLVHTRKAGVTVDPYVISRGARYLKERILQVNMSRIKPKQKNSIYTYERQRMAYMMYVLSEYISEVGKKMDRGEFSALVQEMAQYPDTLSAYSKALIALALHNLGKKQSAKNLLSALYKQGVEDKKTGTLCWTKRGYWYYWYSDPVETAAFALRAILAIEPNSPSIPAVVKWLVTQRQGTRWHSTKATAMAIFALAEYLQQSKELNPNYEVTVRVNGKDVKTLKITEESLFRENAVILSGSAVPSGDVKVEIVKNGKGNLYYSVLLKYFSLEENLTPAGHKISVKRTYTRIRKQNIKQGKILVEKIIRTPLKSGDVLKSGDIVEVSLEINSDQDFEYLIFEDRKPAGMEALRLRSGGTYGVATYMEMKTEMVAIFVSRLPKGKSRLSYKLRAEIPGKFHGMPVKAYCMYSPYVRANSSEFRLEIRDE